MPIAYPGSSLAWPNSPKVKNYLSRERFRGTQGNDSSTVRFEKDRSQCPSTQNHNREMNDILGVVEKALSEIKSNCAGTSRTVTTCANTLDRMVSQLAHEVNKLQSCLEVSPTSSRDYRASMSTSRTNSRERWIVSVSKPQGRSIVWFKPVRRS